ncbi:MAG: hypothetical protein HC836_10775 [Richelia sp. RM2_1_2]|nr:hypothetical protein [Richelia sp. RM2_1_2]
MGGFSVPDPGNDLFNQISGAKSNVTAATAKMVTDLNLMSKLEVATQRKKEIETYLFGSNVAEKGAIDVNPTSITFGQTLPGDIMAPLTPLAGGGSQSPIFIGPMLVEETINADSAPNASINQQPGIPSQPPTGLCPIDINNILAGIGDVVVEELSEFTGGEFPLEDFSLQSEIIAAGLAAYEAVKEALSVLTGIATAALAQLEQLASSITSVIPSQQEVLDFINSMLPDGGSGGMFDQIQTNIENILPSGLDVQEFLSSIEESISSIVGDIGIEIGDLGKALSDIADGVYGHLKTGTQFVITTINGAYTFTLTEANELVAELDDAVSTITGCIGISGVNEIVEKANLFAVGGVSDKIVQVQDQFSTRLVDAANILSV